jgi:hypothetical protein
MGSTPALAVTKVPLLNPAQSTIKTILEKKWLMLTEEQGDSYMCPSTWGPLVLERELHIGQDQCRT